MNCLQTNDRTFAHYPHHRLMRKSPFFSLLPELHTLWGNFDTEHLPCVDVRETDETFELLVDLPGRSEENINVEVNDNVLTLSSQNMEEEEEDKENYRIRERRLRKFSRSFNLPDNIDKDHIAATFRNGVLSIQLPKTPESAPKKIKVQLEKN